MLPEIRRNNMDSRTALSPNTVLRFSSETVFTIKGEVGRGGSCIVYDGKYRTNAGDEKTVRIKECYPFDLPLTRGAENELICPETESGRFERAKEQMYADFRLCNDLYYSESSADSIINTINIYEANHTVYTVSAWSHEQVLSNRALTSLRDCISVVRQTAYALQCIHQAGYLYLDIKPDNISVINGISKHIRLFDFDSLLPLSVIRRDQSQINRISYTKGFAALELRQGLTRKFGFHTDVYGVGALLFFLLFGRTPEAPDCARGASFDFSSLQFAGHYPDKLFYRLESFFHKTLAGFPFDRWQRMEYVIDELGAIEQLADSTQPYLISSVISAPPFYIGRSAETERLKTWVDDDTQRVLFLSGMGGIGKSTFIRHFLTAHRSEWESVAFLFYKGNLCQTLIDDDMLRINGTERLPEEKEADYFERKLRELRKLTACGRILLVIDNFENLHDPDLSRLLELNCKTIFITRRSIGSLNLPAMKLDALQDEDDLFRLFVHHLDREAAPDETGPIRTIIRQLAGHTLAIELFARQISFSFLSPAEASELLRKQGLLHAGADPVDYLRDSRLSYEHLEAIITRLFETDSLTKAQTSLLKAAALFPAPGIEVTELLRLADLQDDGAVRLLVRYGWITRDHDRVYLHPLIRDVIVNIPVTPDTVKDTECVLRTLREDIVSESHKEEMTIREAAEAAAAGNETGAEADPYAFLTDHVRLQTSVSMARGVIDVVENDPQMGGRPAVRKLYHAMVVNLPKHEDEAILAYGMRLLDHPEHLTALEILEVMEPVEKVMLEHQDHEAAFRLMELAEEHVIDERTAAEYCGLMGNIYDFRDAPGDREELLSWLEKGIVHARLAPPPFRKHLLAEFLLGKLNAFTRNGIEDENGIGGLVREIAAIIERDCLPWSEIRCGFATAMGFFWAEIGNDRQKTDEWIAAARAIGEKLYPAGLDFIDNCIIPPAIMYIDMQDYEDSEAVLLEGVGICESHPDLAAYQRKRYDLHCYMLDVFLEAENPAKADQIRAVLDEEARRYGF